MSYFKDHKNRVKSFCCGSTVLRYKLKILSAISLTFCRRVVIPRVFPVVKKNAAGPRDGTAGIPAV